MCISYHVNSKQQRRGFLIIICEINSGIKNRNIFSILVYPNFLFVIKNIVLYNQGSKPNSTVNQLL